MNSIRQLMCLLLLLPVAALAQEKRLEDRLPATTSLCVSWRGMRQIDAAHSGNAVLRLWFDPEFAPAREALSARIFVNAPRTGSRERFTPEELLSLLANPLVFGNRSDVAENGKAGAGAEALGADGTFLIYDATGTAELVQKLLRLEQGNAAAPAKISSYTLGKTTIEAVTGPKKTHYRAFVGSVFLLAEQKGVLEDLVARFASDGPVPDSLTAAADYLPTREHLAEGTALEVFARVPDLVTLSARTAKGPNPAALVHALHLERLHTAVGSLSFAGDAVRIRLTLLGDTTPGGIFDLVGASSETFPTLVAAPAGAVSYSATRIDFPALYMLVRSAIGASLSPQQAGNIELFEGIINKQLGMELRDAVALFGGELASISLESGGDPLRSLYAVTIEKPQEVARLLGLVLSGRMVSEDREGETTYLAITVPYRDPYTASQRQRFYCLGVTPHMLLLAPRKDIVRQAVARLANNPVAASGAGLASEARFTQARTQLPQRLSAFSYADLTRIEWAKLAETLAKNRPKPSNPADSSSSGSVEWEKIILPALLSRYLHTAFGGWWKDGQGVYFDGYIK